jgi:hypothetical protein
MEIPHKKTWIIVQVSAIVVGFALGGQSTYAQEIGSINGTVVDPADAAVSGAQLVLTAVETGITRRALSSAQGYFNFTTLQGGRYNLRVSAAGFETLDMGGLTLNVGQQMTVRPVLQLGTTTQTLNVTAVAPPITTSSAAIEQTVYTKQIMDLPLNGRNPVQLLTIVPGVFSYGTGGQFGMQQLQFVGLGTRTDNFNFALDGGTNNSMFYNLADSYPSPDALEEFTVSTRGVSATLGRGSATVQAQTKSGTNQLHGSAFEFVRNNVFDSRSFFAPAISIFKRNQYGSTLGGPIVKNKAFFFLSYEGTKVRGTPGSTQYQTLTPAERSGDFSAVAKAIIDPQTGNPLPNNIIPTARINSFSANYIAKFLPPGNVSSGNFYSFQPVTTLDQNQLDTRVDYSPGAANRISFRYLFDNMPQVQARTTAVSNVEASALPTWHQNWTLAYTRIFSPALLNEFHATYNRDAFGVRNSNAFPLFDQLGLNSINPGDTISGFGLTGQSHMTVTGFWSDLDAVPVRDIMPNTEIGDMMSWVHGPHTFKFGTQIYKNRTNQIANFLTNGNLSFTGYATGNAGADFLIGTAAVFQQEEPTITRLRQTLPSFYFQDDFRVSRRLTLNLGLRWDPFLGWASEDKALSTFIPGKNSTLFPLALPGMLYPGDAGLPESIVGNRLNNFAPRVGMAWDVFGNGETSLRTSFGMFYVPTTEGISLNRFANIPPFDQNLRVPSSRPSVRFGCRGLHG